MHADSNKVIGRYRKIPFGVRIHLLGRLLTVPWNRILEQFPPGNQIVDIGCGHGLQINLLSDRFGSARVYAGIDWSEKKISVARKTENSYTKFSVAAAGDPLPTADTYCVFDVLYLIPFELQENLLREVYTRLPSGGHLVLKEMDFFPRWKFGLMRLQEFLSVRILRITKGNDFYFAGVDHYRSTLSRMGFTVTVHRIDCGYLHPHVLYICRK